MAVSKNQFNVVDTNKTKKLKAPATVKQVSAALKKAQPSVAPKVAVKTTPVFAVKGVVHTAQDPEPTVKSLREIPQAVSNIVNTIDQMQEAISALLRRTFSVTQAFPIQPLHVPENAEASTELGLELLSIEYRLQNLTATLTDLEDNIQV